MSLSAEAITALRETAKPDFTVVNLPNGGQSVIYPDGCKVQDVAPLNPVLPDNIRSTIIVHDVASLIAYLNRYSTPATVVFAQPGHLSGDGKPAIRAQIDYHSVGDTIESIKPNRLSHAVHYSPRYSAEWLRWSVGGKFDQAALAEFVEECRRDIQEPDAAKLIDIVRIFKATKTVDINMVDYQPNGDITLGWEEKTQVKSMAVPEMLKVAVPVYFGGDRFELNVFMRYRTVGTKVQFELKPDRPEYVEEVAFDDIIKKLALAFPEMPVYLGRIG